MENPPAQDEPALETRYRTPGHRFFLPLQHERAMRHKAPWPEPPAPVPCRSVGTPALPSRTFCKHLAKAPPPPHPRPRREFSHLLDPDATFAGIQPADLAAEAALAQKAREDVMVAEAALRALRHTRNQADRRLAGMLRRFAIGVCAHPDYGSNSPFYRALGFVTDSENRSGRPLKRKI